MNTEGLKFYEEIANVYRFLPEQDPAELDRVALARYLLRYAKGISSALDMGCGEGYLCSLYQEWGIARVVGVDGSSNRLEFGRKRFPNVSFIYTNILESSVEDDSFDLVSAVEVIEHIEKCEIAVREMARIARKYILITVPNEGPIVHTVCPKCFHRFEPAGHVHSFGVATLRELCMPYCSNIMIVDNYWVDHPTLKKLVLPALRRARFGGGFRGNYLGLLGKMK
jgi:ubiquinone/menaquinone biosynthesis C-methylase UbiE